MTDHIIVEDDAGTRLDQWCKRHTTIPFGLAQKLIRKGAIKLDQCKVSASTRLETGNVVTIPEQPEASNAPRTTQTASKVKQRELRSWVITESPECYIINKPPGLAVQGGSGIRDCIDMRLDGLNTSPVRA